MPEEEMRAWFVKFEENGAFRCYVVLTQGEPLIDVLDRIWPTRKKTLWSELSVIASRECFVLDNVLLVSSRLSKSESEREFK